MTATSERAHPRVEAELRELVRQTLLTVLDPELGEPITGRARAAAVGIETNGEYCTSLLRTRYEPVTADG